MKPVLTIGYGKRSLSDVIAELKRHDVQYLVDVRSNPVSRFAPEFCREELNATLKAAGIRYVFMGDLLGGRPADPSCYAAGHVVYDFVRTKHFHQIGIRRVAGGARAGHNICLLCSEGKPEDCHRAKLIGVSLDCLGIEVLHIDNRGELVTQAAIIRRLEPDQKRLFDTSLVSRKTHNPMVPGRYFRD